MALLTQFAPLLFLIGISLMTTIMSGTTTTEATSSEYKYSMQQSY